MYIYIYIYIVKSGRVTLAHSLPESPIYLSLYIYRGICLYSPNYMETDFSYIRIRFFIDFFCWLRSQFSFFFELTNISKNILGANG